MTAPIHRIRTANAARATKRGDTLLLTLVGISLLLMVGLAIADWARFAIYRQQMQSAADASALAGAAKLASLNMASPGPALDAARNEQLVADFQRSAAHRQARLLIHQNLGGGANSNGDDAVAAEWPLLDDDIRISHSEQQANGSPDTLEVTLGRTVSRGNPIEFWTARFLGGASTNLEVHSQAKVLRSIAGFRPADGQRVPCLPLVMLQAGVQSSWHGQYSQTPNAAFNDRYSFDDASGGWIASSDGIPEIVLNLGSANDATVNDVGSSRNAWLANFGATKRSSANWSEQIAGGLGADDLAAFGGELTSGLQVKTAVAAASRPIVEELQSAFAGIQGERRILPLGTWDAQHQRATIRGFVSAAVLECAINSQGELSIVVQPAGLQTATAQVAEGAPQNPWISRVTLTN